MNDIGQKRMKVNLPYTKHELGLHVATLITLIGSVVYLAMEWSNLPTTIAIHFNGKGEPDGWGSKWITVILPAISMLLYVLFAALSRIPHRYNYPVAITEQNAARQYLLSRKLLGWIGLESVMLCCYLQWAFLQSVKDSGDGLGLWSLPIILAVFLGTVAVYLVKAFRTK